jgi:hypothetical protein
MPWDYVFARRNSTAQAVHEEDSPAQNKIQPNHPKEI